MKWGDAPPEVPCPESAKDLVMHTAMQLGSITLMGADAPPGRGKPFGGFDISLDDSGRSRGEASLCRAERRRQNNDAARPNLLVTPVWHVHRQVWRQLDGQRSRPTGIEEKAMQNDVLELLAIRRGHFLLESGHHAELWLDLELLYRRPRRVESLCFELARRLASLSIDAVCGPLIEGAFVGLTVASELDLEYSYAERFARASSDGLFPAGYRIPEALRESVRGKRVAIVNDVINAGSAVRGTYVDLQQCGAIVVAIGTLLVLGTSADEFAAHENLALETLARQPNTLWTPGQCPLCAAGMALVDPAEFGAGLRST